MIVVMMVVTILLLMSLMVIQYIIKTNQLSLECIKTDKFRNLAKNLFLFAIRYYNCKQNLYHRQNLENAKTKQIVNPSSLCHVLLQFYKDA